MVLLVINKLTLSMSIDYKYLEKLMVEILSNQIKSDCRHYDNILIKMYLLYIF